jgi:hypothetical protein
VAPTPNPPTVSNVAPSLQLPNEEIRLAEMSVTPTDLSPRSQAVQAGTTSPVDSLSVELPHMAPETMSRSTEEPTPTAVLSLSDLKMLEGTLRLPPLNELAAARTAAWRAR